MKMQTFLISVAMTLAVPALAQTGPGYGPQWGGYSGGWMPGQGWFNGPMMGGQPGYGTGAWGPDGSSYGMMQGWRDPNAPGRGRFATIDVNEDGIVSAEEAASQADMVFTAMDGDDNGSITLDEFMTVRMGPQAGMNPEREGMMQEKKSARFEPMDADKDGAVSKAEFIAASKAHFDASDTDQDGKVTPWEIRASNWN
jgi:Ca2+-binding EF-hand superfamily protein